MPFAGLSEAAQERAYQVRQKATKTQEFVAHGAAVNCLSVGRRSAAVLATGGDDKKVNIWSVGKPTAIMSLAGHTSAIECVTFDREEQTVIEEDVLFKGFPHEVADSELTFNLVSASPRAYANTAPGAAMPDGPKVTEDNRR